MSDLTITLLILVVAVVLFVWNRLPVGIVALGVALSLWATGVLTLDESLAGFGSPTVVFIASLFVVAEALDASGITTWAGQQVIAHAGDSQTRLLVLTMLTGALLSALITPNGAAAALIPMVVILAVRSRLSPSRLLMPLAFSAHAGSLLALTGSPVNVLISEAASDAGGSELRFFEFARVGVPLLVGTILIVVLLGPRLLTERGAKTLPRDLSQLPRALLRQYIQEADFARLEVSPASSLVGSSGEAIDLRPYDNVHVIGVLDSRGQPLSDAAMSAGSVLVVRGQHDDIERFATDHALSVQSSPANGSVGYGLVSREYGVAEVIVTPRSAYVGTTVFPGMVTESGELVILAVQRQGEDLGPGEARIKAGDSLLLQGTWAALDEQTRDANVLLVDSPDAIRRQTAPLGPQAMRGPGCARRDDHPLDDRCGPGGGGRTAGRDRDDLAGGRHGRAGASFPLLDDADSGGGNDPPLDRHHPDGGRRPAGGHHRPCRGRRGAVRALARRVPHRRRARPVDQQHGDRTDSDPDRGLDCDGNGHVAAAAADVCQCGVGGGLADPGGNPGQHDGHGAWRIPVH